MKNPITLKDEAQIEAYIYFDKNIRPLPKNSNGVIDSQAHGLVDNDVDAFRHAYVSGVYTQEFGEAVADVLGRLYEAISIGNSQPGDKAYTNMDLWNNAVGRKCGRKAKDKKSLLKLIHKALKKGDLILSPNDARMYNGETSLNINKSKPVIVLKQGKKGRNEVFFDIVKEIVLSVSDFLSLIQAGEYQGYSIKTIRGKLTPVSKPDSHGTNNLD